MFLKNYLVLVAMIVYSGLGACGGIQALENKWFTDESDKCKIARSITIRFIALIICLTLLFLPHGLPPPWMLALTLCLALSLALTDIKLPKWLYKPFRPRDSEL